ncbi:MAG: hypothetical protein ABIO83_01760 [Ilumatobacteraceae bacterium]
MSFAAFVEEMREVRAAAGRLVAADTAPVRDVVAVERFAAVDGAMFVDAAFVVAALVVFEVAFAALAVFVGVFVAAVFLAAVFGAAVFVAAVFGAVVFLAVVIVFPAVVVVDAVVVADGRLFGTVPRVVVCLVPVFSATGDFAVDVFFAAAIEMLLPANVNAGL